MNKSYLTQAARQAHQGMISQSIQTLSRQTNSGEQTYSLFSNLSALHLQLGEYNIAIDYSAKAILLDPFSYIAYYNRFLCYMGLNNQIAAWIQLQRSLSCLNMIKGYQEKNLKLLNRAIYYCQHNAKAYLMRAILNQGKNSKLVENDYSAAAEYGPEIAEIYQQRALFFRKNGRKQQFEQDLKVFLNLKKNQGNKTNQYQLTLSDSLPIPNIKDKIEEGVRQFQQLMLRSRSNLNKSGKQITDSQQLVVVSKLPLNSIQSRLVERRDDEDLLLSDRPEAEDGTAKTIQIKKEQIKFKKRNYQDRLNKNFDQIFNDETSKDLNQEIERLEKEIEAEGGKIGLEKSDEQLDVSDPNNFLTLQIQKAIQEIAELGNKDALNEVKSVKSAHSGGSLGSKLSQPRQLSTDQFKRYQQFSLQIVSMQDLQMPNRKEAAKIEIRYNGQKLSTGFGKFEWGENFRITIAPDCCEVDISANLKGGVFKSNILLGEGSINLLETGQIKCILGNKDKKTAILYYKLKLH